MRERINRLARGIIDSSVPELVIKPERIEGVLSPGESVRGEFSVQSGNDLYIKGLVYSGNERVKLESEAFGGLRNHIIYNIDTRYLEDGDTVKGSFYLVTNGGEKEIPYSLRIQTGNRTEELGSLKTPRDFAALAKKNGTTRATASMDKAAAMGKKLIFAIGNAPTALVRLYELIEDGKLDPELIIGVPVGFVNVVQSKELIMQADVPYIVARGRKGGSNVAACICNALLYMIDNNRGY